MTLEITITDTVAITELLAPVVKWLKKLASYFKPSDDTADTPDVDKVEDNKSPPISTQPSGCNCNNSANATDELQNICVQICYCSINRESFDSIRNEGFNCIARRPFMTERLR